MNRSYRLKVENWIKTKTITEELLLICIARINPLIEEFAYKEKKYDYVDIEIDKSKDCYKYSGGGREYAEKKQFYSNIRNPMIDILIKNYQIPFEIIILKIKDIPENKLPTIKVCKQVHEVINSNTYLLE